MASTATAVPFTGGELHQLEELSKETLEDGVALRRPKLAKKLHTYARHLQRIQTITRVLDPSDTAAVFNAHHGTEATLRAELERRKAELPAIESALTNALAKEV